MKSSYCQCGNRLYFENTFCHTCNSELGFLPDALSLGAIRPVANSQWQATFNNRFYRKCQHYEQHRGCNWMVAAEDANTLCLSCRLTDVIPDLSQDENIKRWQRIERAKRRLLYSLYRLQLPVIDKTLDAEKGLCFRLMQDQSHFSEFVSIQPERDRIMTGHLNGIITLNIEEADPVLREEMRTRLQERYRTLLGHLRHESGHYYWERLLQLSPWLDEFRALFGNESADYDAALQNYYENGPQTDWQSRWISAYASAHPWEDWAESWAHYLHMIDTLETAGDFCVDGNDIARDQIFDKPFLASLSIQQLVSAWDRLSVALNEMNRSMGLADAYPFVLSSSIVDKLGFVHDLLTGRKQAVGDSVESSNLN